jgi:hypothetical protein
MGLSVSEGKHSPLFAPTAVHKHSPLFAPTAVHKTSCTKQQLSVQMAIANSSYYLPTTQDGQFRISCPITSI